MISRLQCLFNRAKILGILTNNISLWKDTAFLLAIVINLMVFFSYKRNEDEELGFYSGKYIQNPLLTKFKTLTLKLEHWEVY